MKLIKLLLLLSCVSQVEAAQLAAAARAVRTRAVQMHAVRRAMSSKPLKPDMARLKDGTIVDLTKNHQSQESTHTNRAQDTNNTSHVKANFDSLDESFKGFRESFRGRFTLLSIETNLYSLGLNILFPVIYFHMGKSAGAFGTFVLFPS